MSSLELLPPMTLSNRSATFYHDQVFSIVFFCDFQKFLGLRINNLINSLGDEGLDGARAVAGEDLTAWATGRVEEIQPYSAIRGLNKETSRAPGDLSDGESSGDDDGQMLTREAIKKQAQNIIDSKTKKRKIKKGRK